MTKRLKNIHPGEILLEEFLIPLGISQNAAARAMEVPPRRINEICLEKRGVTADTALRLAHFLGTTPQFWLGLQNDYDLEEQQQESHYNHIHSYESLSARGTVQIFPGAEAPQL